VFQNRKAKERKRKEKGSIMLKKVVLTALLVGLIGILVAGGVIRTLDKTGNVAEARGRGEGLGYASNDTQGRGQSDLAQSDYGRGQGQGGNGGGGGQGQGAGGDRLYPNYENPPDEWAIYEGTVIEAPTDGGDMVIETADGQEIVVGTGPSYMQAQGFTLQAGENVQVQGYWENGELRAAQVTRQSDGQTIILRDQTGRPAWAGGGRQAYEPVGSDQQGVVGQGVSIGQAEALELLNVRGTVVSVDTTSLVVETADGSQIEVQGRPWWFAQEQGFSAGIGDEVTLLGYSENGEFIASQLSNLATSTTVNIREEGGRPLWAGGGGRGQ
jgi:hypothetical protein